MSKCCFCVQEADIEIFDTWVCADCAEKLFDPNIGTGSVASKPILHPAADKKNE
jgi:hypothetical protein